MPDGDSGLSTFGPTGEVKGGMSTGVGVEDQQGGCLSLSLVHHWEKGLSLMHLWEREEGGEVEINRHHRHLLHPPGIHPPPGCLIRHHSLAS